jgi:nucleotide-binding universal stress UspA family protein
MAECGDRVDESPQSDATSPDLLEPKRRDPMQPFRTILFAADFSENSQEAFRMACALAVESQTRLIVVHVVHPDRVAAERISSGLAALGNGDLHSALDRRMRATYTPNRPIDVEYRTKEGSASVEILRAADEVGADLIVMGTHGLTGLRRLLTGSVASTVLHRAHGSVLALRSDRRPHPVSELRVILHPTDFSEASESALGVARSLAREPGARLILLHVIPPGLAPTEKMGAESEPQDHQLSLDGIRSRFDGPDLKYPLETRLSRGSPAEEILRTAREVGADLIVMGTHGVSALRWILMGSVAEFVLSQAECPVMVMKTTEQTSSPTVDRPAATALCIF